MVVVSGGGAGIGAAIAEELGRNGVYVVTMDPMVTLDGAARLESSEQTTAQRIVAAGGTRRVRPTFRSPMPRASRRCSRSWSQTSARWMPW